MAITYTKTLKSPAETHVSGNPTYEFTFTDGTHTTIFEWPEFMEDFFFTYNLPYEPDPNLLDALKIWLVSEGWDNS